MTTMFLWRTVRTSHWFNCNGGQMLEEYTCLSLWEIGSMLAIKMTDSPKTTQGEKRPDSFSLWWLPSVILSDHTVNLSAPKAEMWCTFKQWLSVLKPCAVTSCICLPWHWLLKSGAFWQCRCYCCCLLGRVEVNTHDAKSKMQTDTRFHQCWLCSGFFLFSLGDPQLTSELPSSCPSWWRTVRAAWWMGSAGGGAFLCAVLLTPCRGQAASGVTTH